MANSMSALKQKFESLSSRERHIVIVLGLVMAVFLLDRVLISPLQESNKKARQQINALTSQLNAQNAQIKSLAGGTDLNDQYLPLRQKIEGLQRSVMQIDNQIDLMTADMIPPRKMTEVLERVLRENTRLTLLKVSTIPVEKVTAGSTDGSDNAGLFRHGVEIELQGGYFEALEYLQSVEALPWKVIWQEMDYNVESYPEASIKLKLNTLSRHAGWIGA